MTENLCASEFVAPDLVNKMEEAAVSAARDILTGRRIIDVDGPYGLGLTSPPARPGRSERRAQPRLVLTDDLPSLLVIQAAHCGF
jgi:hypothetical protein